MQTTLELKQDQQLATVVAESGLQPAKAQVLLSQFSNFFERAQELQVRASTLKVKDITDTATMKMARIARLEIKDMRVQVEKVRKQLKEDSLREGKVIDGIANVMKGLLEPIENYLQEQEDFAKNAEEQRIREVKAQRELSLMAYDVLEMPKDLGTMSDELFSTLLAGLEAKRQQAIEEARQAEARRIEREKAEAAERERMRLENERLRQEAAANEEAMRVEREKAEAERKAQEAALRAEREKAEAERRERERLEQELREKAEAEQKAIEAARAKELAEAKAKEAAERKAKNAPDKDKLLALVADIREAVNKDYGIRGEDAQVILKEAKATLVNTMLYIEAEAIKL